MKQSSYLILLMLLFGIKADTVTGETFKTFYSVGVIVICILIFISLFLERNDSTDKEQ